MNHNSPKCPKYVRRTNIRRVKNGPIQLHHGTEMVSAGLYLFVSRVMCFLSFAYVSKQLGDKADSFSILQIALEMASLCILRSFLLFIDNH